MRAHSLTGKRESFKVKKIKIKIKKPKIKVFDAPSTFHNFANKKANCKWLRFLMLHFKTVALKRNVSERSTLGGFAEE